MFEGALCRLDCWSNAQTSARPVGYFIWRKNTQMQLNLPSFLAFPSPFGFLPLFRHFPSSKAVQTASSNELTTGKYLKMADSFCGFVSKQRLFMSWRSWQISFYEGREGDQKDDFLKNVSLWIFLWQPNYFSYSSYENNFFSVFSVTDEAPQLIYNAKTFSHPSHKRNVSASIWSIKGAKRHR